MTTGRINQIAIFPRDPGRTNAPPTMGRSLKKGTQVVSTTRQIGVTFLFEGRTRSLSRRSGRDRGGSRCPLVASLGTGSTNQHNTGGISSHRSVVCARRTLDARCPKVLKPNRDRVPRPGFPTQLRSCFDCCAQRTNTNLPPAEVNTRFQADFVANFIRKKPTPDRPIWSFWDPKYRTLNLPGPNSTKGYRRSKSRVYPNYSTHL